VAALTYLDRNAKAALPAIALAAQTDFTVPTTAPGFAEIEATTMGNLGTNADGFYPVYNPMVAAEPEHTTQVDAMSKSASAATFTPGATSGKYYHPIGVQIQTTGATGDKQMGDFNSAMGLSSPAPTSGGGSGGGGTGGGTPTGGRGGDGGGGGGGQSPICKPDDLTMCPELVRVQNLANNVKTSLAKRPQHVGPPAKSPAGKRGA